jgi:pyruvate formate lyase activating enzyme
VLFTQGCNFRCSYCHNPSLVYPEYFKETVTTASVLEFLKKRAGQLDGVVLTGGEPLIHKNLPELTYQIKTLGYAVKLDTNGYFPHRLQTLLEHNLIDYIAMDIKAPFDKYAAITRRTSNIERIKQSIRIVLTATSKYEFRITLNSLISNKNDVESIGQCIEGAALVYLQKSTFPENCPLSEKDLTVLKQILGRYVTQCHIR